MEKTTPLFTNRTKNLILRKVSNKMVSAAKINEELNLNMSPKTVLRPMSKSPNLRFAKMLKMPILSEQHKERRQAWCLDKINMGQHGSTLE